MSTRVGRSVNGLLDPLTGFRAREQLVLDLEDALAPDVAPSVIAVFDLSGLSAYERALGERAGDALIARLANRFARVIEPAGVCYRAREDEFWAIVRTLISEAGRPVLEEASEELSEQTEFLQLTASFGAALLPDEGDSPIDALMLADRRLAAVATVRTRRDRRV
jgi:GGDEF domain-containing protein